MAEGTPEITLGAVHEDLTAGFADFKAEILAAQIDAMIRARNNGDRTV